MVLCLITILWLPMVKSSQGGQIFIYLNAVQAYFGTPVGMVYLWGILWKRCSEKVSIIWALSGENLSSGCPTKRVSNQSPQLQRLARKLKFHLQQVYN